MRPTRRRGRGPGLRTAGAPRSAATRSLPRWAVRPAGVGEPALHRLACERLRRRSIELAARLSVVGEHEGELLARLLVLVERVVRIGQIVAREQRVRMAR